MTAPAAAPTRYPLARVQELLGLSRTVIRRLVDAGFVTPIRGPGNRLGFSFEDLVLLRSADALLKAQVPPRRVLAALTKLRKSLPADLPLTGLRISAVGSQVVVRDRQGAREAHSGQWLMDFEVAPSKTTKLAFLVPATPAPTAAQHFERGAAAETEGDVAGAEAAYRSALEIDPAHLDACLNLGALWSESGRSAQALALYRTALAQGVDAALLHYNHAIALEDTGYPRDALVAYGRALALDERFADAHFNAARLLEQLGDKRGALRHFSAYRRAHRGK